MIFIADYGAGNLTSVENALRHLGLDVREIPALPEHVMEAARARA